MRPIVITFIISILTSISTFSQQKIEAFKKDGKIGIVHKETLAEVFLAKSIENRIVNINDNYIAFRGSNNYLSAIHKTNLTWIEPIALSENCPTVSTRENIFLHVIRDNQSVLLDSNFLIKYRFAGKNKSIRFFKESEKFCYTQNDDFIQIYEIQDNQPKLVHNNIIANRFTKDFLEREGRKEEVYVFYGLEKIYVFDKTLILIKEINKSISNSWNLYDVINSIERDYTLGVANPNQRENVRRRDNVQKYSKESENEERIFFSSKSSTIKIGTYKGYEVKSSDSKNIIVYKVFITSNGKTRTKKIGNENSFSFLIDETSKKAFLPIKYQKEIGLEIHLK